MLRLLPTTVTLWAVVLATVVFVTVLFVTVAGPVPSTNWNNLLSANVYLYPPGSGKPPTTPL